VQRDGVRLVVRPAPFLLGTVAITRPLGTARSTATTGARVGLQTGDETGQAHVESIGDALRRSDGRRVPATLDLTEVLRIHALETEGDLLQRLTAGLPHLAYGAAELLGGGVSLRPARQWTGRRKRTSPASVLMPKAAGNSTCSSLQSVPQPDGTRKGPKRRCCET